MVPTVAMSDSRHKYLEMRKIPWPKTSATHSNALDKGRAIKALVNGYF